MNDTTLPALAANHPVAAADGRWVRTRGMALPPSAVAMILVRKEEA